MAAMPSSAEGGNPPTNECKIPATMEIRAVGIREIGEVTASATTTTVNAQVTPSSSVPTQTSDQPL